MAGAQVGLPGPFLEPPVRPCPVSDSDSDSEDTAVGGTGPNAAAQNSSQVIHSGHFMVSCPHSDSLPRRRHHHAEPEPADPWSIDPTLTRLFECMSLEYSGKLVSPKWKNFKGLQLLCWDKIRLNNVIWRAWYIQYVERRKNPVCSFITPLEGMEADEHRKPEAVVLEGNYWKRRIEVVMREYHKWRIYYKKRLRKSTRDGVICSPKRVSLLRKGGKREKGEHHLDPCTGQKGKEKPQGISPLEWDAKRLGAAMCQVLKWKLLGEAARTLPTKGIRLVPLLYFMQDEDAWRPTEKWCNQLFCNVVPMLLGDEEEERGSRQHFDLDTFLSDISDTLFTMTQMPSTHQALPEDAYVGNADMIQPDLAPLQPSLDDMDISEIFTSHRPTPSQTQSGYQDPSCFSHMAEPLFSSEETLMGARSLPVSPEAPLLPGTLLQPSGASQPSLHSTFPGSEMPLAPLPPDPPDVAPSSLSPQLRLKPTLQYDFPGKCLSLEPPAPHCVPPIPSPRAPLLSPEPLFSPASAPRFKFPYSSSPDPSLVTHPASPLSSPCFTPYIPGLGYATGMGPQGYPSPAAPQLLPPTLLGNPRFAPPKGVPQGGGGRPKAKPSGTKSRRLQGHPLSHLPEPNPCPSQLLTTVGLVAHGCPPCWEVPNGADLQLESRRITHISAEQKRRFNIKLGFTTLHSLVSTLSAQPSIKVSKATTLQKTAEYICKLQQERAALQDEALRLREQIEELNGSINLCQEQLPATGVPITRQRFDHMRRMFDEYVCSSTLQNWKFWIFSIIIRPLFESFNDMVSTASMESLTQTSLTWLDQHCSLPALRPTVLSSLRQLSISTSILSDPARVPEQAARAVGALGHPGASSST
ncbi:carbohydrate-responsive element-binding protein [Turdus rufiventris]|nr:carbohydrate-responsive element-binding protein [Turdus rufiventris]